MRIATRTPFIRPTAPRIVLAVLCIVSLMVLTQCTMTADKVTGVDIGAGGISTDKAQPQTHGQLRVRVRPSGQRGDAGEKGPAQEQRPGLQ
jgi:hypothetical protein